MTVKITVIKEDKVIQLLVMEQDRLSIGRREGCDITIPDPAVSGLHAEIEFVGNGYILRDLESTNGVHIKGRQIKEHALKNEDLITIGEHQLRVVITDKAPTIIGAVPGKKAVFEDIPRDVTEVKSTSASVPRTNATRIEGYLKCIKGGEPGQVIKLEDSMTSIGVAGVQMAAVSKRPQGHFIIHVDGGKERDKTPVVNGEAIGFKSRKLELGDQIEVAGIQFEYCSN